MRDSGISHDTNVEEKSRVEKKEHVRGENQKSRTSSLSKKLMGVTTMALLAGSAMADLSSTQASRSSALDHLRVRGSSNVMDYISPPPLPSPEYLRKIGEDPKRFYQEASQGTPGGEIPPAFPLRKMIPHGETSRSAIETPPRQLERRESKRRESLEPSNKVLAPKENRAVQKDFQDVLNNKETIEDMNNLLKNKEFGKDILLLLKNKEILKNLPSLCQRPEFHKFLGALVKNQNAMDSLRPLYQDQKFMEDVSKLCQKPEIEESLRSLFNDQALQRNLAPIQGPSGRPEIYGRKLLWQSEDMDNSGSGEQGTDREGESLTENEPTTRPIDPGHQSQSDHDRDRDRYMDNGDKYRRDVYKHGYDDGDANGYKDGYNDGKRDGYKRGYDDGGANGYNRGYDDGKANGYKHGYDHGKLDGYNRGYDDGKANGYKHGYDALSQQIWSDQPVNPGQKRPDKRPWAILPHNGEKIRDNHGYMDKKWRKSNGNFMALSTIIVCSAILFCGHKCQKKKQNRIVAHPGRVIW